MAADNMKNFSISSLSEYITLVEKHNLTDFISRGEAEKHDAILASAFRPFAKHRKYYNEKHIKQFYDYIGNGLTEMQKKHFLALSQHSGLPTFLLDFTTSPLISLFFACYKEVYTDNSNGFIYFIDNKRLVPIDEHIQNGFSGSLTEGFKNCDTPQNLHLFEHWISETDLEPYEVNDKEFTSDYLKMIISFIDIIANQDSEFTKTEMSQELNNMLISFKSKSFDNFDHLQNALLTLLQDMFKLFPEGSYIEDVVRVNWLRERFDDGRELLDSEYPYPWDHDPFYENPYEISWQSILSYLLYIVSEFLPYSTEKKYYLPFYATYSPPNISGRVTTQNSIFICQTFMSAKRHKNEFKPYKEFLVTQEIEPDYVFEIHNQKEILRQLDSIGINLKSVFGDNDNIAKHIKNQLLNN